MTGFGRFPDKISVRIPADETGMTGRECPVKECLGYFKIEFGTGLKGEGLPCHCPHCGHTAGHDHFWTQEQIEYARSVGIREISGMVRRELKKLEFDIPARGPVLIGVSGNRCCVDPAGVTWHDQTRRDSHGQEVGAITGTAA